MSARKIRISNLVLIRKDVMFVVRKYWTTFEMFWIQTK